MDITAEKLECIEVEVYDVAPDVDRTHPSCNGPSRPLVTDSRCGLSSFGNTALLPAARQRCERTERRARLVFPLHRVHM
jgi:hypothetical protein